MNCNGCGFPMTPADMGLNFKGEKVEYHGFQAKCVELLRDKLKQSDLQIEAVKKEAAEAQVLYQRVSDDDDETIDRLQASLKESDRLLSEFQKDCDCGDRGCCLRIRQGRPGVLSITPEKRDVSSPKRNEPHHCEHCTCSCTDCT